MSLSYRVAISTAVAFSALSLYDAVYRGVTGAGSVFSDEYGTTWATVVAGALSTIAFSALAVALVTARADIDRGSAARRLLRRLLVVDFAALAAIYVVGAPFLGDPGSPVTVGIGIVAGVAFLSMFVLAFTLGLSIVRIRDLRVSAVLLLAVVPLLGLVLALEALGVSFAHPAYAETAVYLGVALLARRNGAVEAGPAQTEPATHPTR